MDLMKLDEGQRLAWLRANRVTLILVGFIWLGMIGWELWQGRRPIFLAAALPVIAGFRWLAFRYYQRVDRR
jgi:hypothetical protein